MKVLIMGINASWSHSCLPLYYLRNAIAGLDYEVQILELTLKQSLMEALETVWQAKPDVLCLSVYIWNSDFFRAFIPEIRKLLPQTIIIIGGPEATYNEQALPKYNPDYLIKGYGEQALCQLAKSGFRHSEQVISASPLPLMDIPFPYLETDKPALKGKMLYYEASRGCAYQCIYCLSSRDEVQDWLTLERVKTDIDKLLTFQPKVIKFVDRSFNQKRGWARAIWQYVISLDTDIPFHFEIHPDLIEAADIEILRQAPAGRVQFEIGIQSIHPSTLKAIKRYSEWPVVQTNLISLKQHTCIPLHTDLIVGLPNEGIDNIRSGINAVLSTYPDELQLGFLKILAGTPMAEQATEKQYLWMDTPPYQVLQSDRLSFSELLHLERIAAIINQYWNKADFPTVWKQAIQMREPYQCLAEILAIHLSFDAQLHSIDRLKRFEVMATWIKRCWNVEQDSDPAETNHPIVEQDSDPAETNHPCQPGATDPRAYLTDALNWDWCRKSGEAWFPAFMKAGQALEFRKEHYIEILDWLKSEYWQQEDWNLKRFTVFSATSSSFCTDYLEGYTKAIFISRKDEENAMVIYPKRF